MCTKAFSKLGYLVPFSVKYVGLKSYQNKNTNSNITEKVKNTKRKCLLQRFTVK